MKCQACDGEIVFLKGMPHLDERGVCRECGGVLLWESRAVLAKTWCTCPDTIGQQVFFFSDSGNHGWLHTVCGQVTQTG